jgi:hypothetical protein
VITSGTTVIAVDATFGAGTLVLGEVIAGAWMQQVGATVFPGALGAGQQL